MVVGVKISQTVVQKAQEYAAPRAGVLTMAQADAIGISRDVRRRLFAEGVWRRVAPGVLAIGADSWLQRCWAGLVIAGPQAVLGQEAVLHLSHLAPACDPIPIFAGRQAGFPRDDRWRFVRSARSGQGAPPCTSLSAAIIDVGARWLPDDYVGLVGRAVTSRQVSPAALTVELRRRQRHPQRQMVADIIEEVAGGTTTALEHHYRHQVELPHGLPIPQRQARPGGRYRVDNWYRLFRLIVEVDGRATHLGVAASVDLERDRYHLSLGLLTLRFTWADVVRTPCRTARTVADALSRHGWTGQLQLCPRCPQHSTKAYGRRSVA
jgi:very-short-patch-repair endonuclease